jgi:hypothetical protein
MAIKTLRNGLRYLCIEERTGRALVATHINGKLVFQDGSFIELSETSDVTIEGHKIIFHG